MTSELARNAYHIRTSSQFLISGSILTYLSSKKWPPIFRKSSEKFILFVFSHQFSINLQKSVEKSRFQKSEKIVFLDFWSILICASGRGDRAEYVSGLLRRFGILRPRKRKEAWHSFSPSVEKAPPCSLWFKFLADLLKSFWQFNFLKKRVAN